MSGKPGKSLTVGQYSEAVLSKYLRRQFSADPRQNLAAAGEQLYEVLSKVRGAAAKDSEDAKAPLKAIRNSIDGYAFHGAQGTDSPEVEALLQLYAQLEEACQERIAGRGDREAALAVQDALRYRLTRLVAENSWDARPQLKLRVLKLMFRFMVRDNERIAARTRGLEGEAEAPPIRVVRQSSFGRRAMAAAAAAPTHSKWQEAINELSRMPGGRMLPLLKLTLLENLQLSCGSAAAGGAAGAPAAATTVASAALAAEDTSAATASTVASGGSGSYNGSNHSAGSTGARVSVAPTSSATPALAGRLREPPPPPPLRQQRAAAPAPAPAPPPAAAIMRQQPQQAQQAPPAATINLDDLLGLNDEPLPQEEVPTHSPSPPPSSLEIPAEQLFSAFDQISPTARGSSSYAAAAPAGLAPPQHNPFAVGPTAEAVRSQLGGMTVGGTGPQPQPQEQWPAFNPFAAPPQKGQIPSQFQPAAAAPGTFGRTSPAGLSKLQSEGSGAGMQMYGSGSSAAQVEQAFAGGDPGADAAAAPGSPPSPYIGKSNPFIDTRFSELAPPLQQVRRAPPPPPPATPVGPPMRTLSNKAAGSK